MEINPDYAGVICITSLSHLFQRCEFGVNEQDIVGMEKKSDHLG